MIQRVRIADSVAEDVAARIAEALKPWRIVLFGSRARGDWKEDSDYDFYVEVDAPDGDALRDTWHRIHSLCATARQQYDFKVGRRGELERERDDPGTIEWDVAREGHVLYADPGASVDIRPPTSVRERPPRSFKSVRRWIELAQVDLDLRDMARKAGDPRFSAQICWLSHQACEKYMKALLVARDVRPARTHSLIDLLAASREAGFALENLDADCALLTKHAITPRYDTLGTLGVHDAAKATAAADRVINAMRSLLPRRAMA